MIYYAIDDQKNHFLFGEGFFSGPSGVYTVVKADADGWIEWSGGECPLPDDCPYESKSGRGQIIYAEDPQRDNWKTRLSHGIIAYRPILEPQAEQAKGWRGPEDDLPPVGTVCEFKASPSTEWIEGKVVAHRSSAHRNAVAVMDSNYHFYWVRNVRPIRTDRERWVEAAMEAMKDDAELLNVKAARLYDAGLAKLPEQTK